MRRWHGLVMSDQRLVTQSYFEAFSRQKTQKTHPMNEVRLRRLYLNEAGSMSVATAHASLLGFAGTAAAPFAAGGVELVAHGDFHLARVAIIHLEE